MIEANRVDHIVLRVASYFRDPDGHRLQLIVRN
jgi:hypothetical protein